MAELREYRPTVRDRIASWVIGDERPSAYKARVVRGLLGSTGLGNEGLSVSDATPLGLLFGVNEAAREGDAQGMALAAMPGGAAVRGGRGILTGATKPIRAYHGSPHDFDKFDMSKIGTGEGAQSYGHGLYFAENPATAADYRIRLSGEAPIERLKVGTVTVGPHNAFDYSRRAGENTVENIRASLIEDVLIDEAGLVGAPDKQKFILQKLDERAAGYKDEWPESLPAVAQLRKELASSGAVDLKMGRQPGKMYEVNIHADPAKMLDWDAPLNRQSGPAIAALDKSGLRFFSPEKKNFSEAFVRASESNTPAHEAYAELRQRFGDNKVAVSDRLKDAGIPGIKYLDQGSRRAGDGTRNYVMFDDSLIEILRKYGLAGGMVGAGMGAGSEAMAAP